MQKIFSFTFLLLSILNGYGQNSSPTDTTPKIYYPSVEAYLTKGKLECVLEVKVKPGLLTLTGYESYKNGQKLVTIAVEQGKGESLWVSQPTGIFAENGLLFSIMTVPFKIRPAQNNRRAIAEGNLNNLGLNLNVIGWHTDAYYWRGNKASHDFNIGFLLAPGVVELDAQLTHGFLPATESSSQLFLSTALTLNYSYKSVTFSFVPLGYDFGVTPTGQRWAYHNSYWYGFGFGINPAF